MCGECCCGEGRGYRRMGGFRHAEGYGPGRFAGGSREGARHFGFGPGGGFGWGYGPTKAERKEWLEEFKKHLEERLSDVNDELGQL